MNQWSSPTKLPTDSETSLPYLVAASGGNAGLAAASAARIIGLPCTIFVPDAQENIRHIFERHNTHGNVEVRVGGENYYQALLRARAFAEELGPKAYVMTPLLLQLWISSKLDFSVIYRLLIPPYGKASSLI